MSISARHQLFFLFAFVFTTVGPAAHALYIPGKASPSSPKNILSEAAKLGLSEPASDTAKKQAISKWKKSRTDEHLESLAPDPLLLEESDTSANLDQAKTMARYYLYTAVKNNWPKLQPSSINEIAAEVGEWDKFENVVLKHQLDKMEYSASKSKDYYIFSVQPWGTVMVKRDLKQVKWEISSAHHSDGNRLEEGADKIIIRE